MTKLLKTCAQIEDTVGKVYLAFLGIPGVGSELQEIWSAMARDEEDHARQIRFSLRLPQESVFTDAPQIDEDQAEALLRRVEQVHELAGRGACSVQEAIRLTMELEQEFCKVHIAYALQFKDGSMREMFSALAASDSEHTEKFKVFLQKAGSQV